ncbi:GNAT family N-acetyltransferase [Allorhizocola rhizosphaerae]|uniref:GNAT family N-acetyltransferase n=1 Tax=Allorhizocola rhizosphaerae TaxID=1872709 RepID=UPI0013C2D0FF|nr:GNAT family N-acetyltransferase [Allorhizocola rhizosphaerae]
MISIEDLSDHPYLVPGIGLLRWQECGHPPEPTDPQWWTDATGREAGRHGLPKTWVAIDDATGGAVGAVGLGEFDIAERRDRSPWILGLIVAPERRGEGIGRALLSEVERHTDTTLWAATGQAVGYFRRCGWEVAEILSHTTVLMKDTILRRYERAQLFFAAKDYSVAIGLLEGVVADAPTEVAPRELLARAYYHSARLRQAERELRWIVERHPTEAYAHLMLGRTLQRLGRREEAESWLRIAAALGATT